MRGVDAMPSLREAIRSRSADRAGRLLDCSVEVESVAEVSPSFRRVTVVGAGLAAYTDPTPADAFRLFPPGAGDDDGDDGPGLSRAFTVRSFDPGTRRLTFDVHSHGTGLVARWLDDLAGGDVAGIIGMRIEFVVGSQVGGARPELTILAADVCGLPAVAAIVAALPPEQRAVVVISGAAPADRELLPDRPGDDVRWVPAGSLTDGVRALPRPRGGTLAWVAGEAGEVRAIRRVLLTDLGVARDDLRAAAYWKAGVTSDDVDAQAAQRYDDAVAAGRDVSDPDVLEDLALG
ncbi:siderophore-interacting protein [Frankia sp. R43]|uniref:siderophore-interacting protein n=1 Tax=Frankia sp. R43 TaxID=269536 RepID=UPI001F22047F|nr:siderophore-interacting protein [Frankia sp. R43]